MGERLVRILGVETAGSQEMAVLDAVLVRIEEPPCASQPAARLRPLGFGVVAVRHLDRHEPRSPAVPPLLVARVRALVRGDRLIEPAHPDGRFGQQLEVLGRQGHSRVGRLEMLERVVPGVTLERLPPGLEPAIWLVGHGLEL